MFVFVIPEHNHQSLYHCTSFHAINPIANEFYADDEFDASETGVFEDLVSQLSSKDDTMSWAAEQRSVLEELVQEIMSISKTKAEEKPCGRKSFGALVCHLTRFPRRSGDRSLVSPQGAATSLPVLLLLLRRSRYVSTKCDFV